MKRLFAAILAAAAVFSLLGCVKVDRPWKEEPKEGPVGTTLKSDMVEVTLTAFGFAEEGVSIDEEQPDVFCKPVPFPYQLTGNEMMDNLTLQLSQSTYVRATEAKCVAYLEFTVKITSEEMLKQGVMPTILFNGTDEYTLNAISGEALADYFNGQYDGAYFRQDGDNWESMPMFWSTGAEYVCRGVAKIPVEVEQNTDAPLTVSFSLPSSDGTSEAYTFIIR